MRTHIAAVLSSANDPEIYPDTIERLQGFFTVDPCIEDVHDIRLQKKNVL